MKKEKFFLSEEQLIKIEKCFEDEDIVQLEKICEELEVELDEVKTFDTMSYKLLENIEKNEELVEILREISKERKGLQKLFPYYQKVENMRYFIEHKDEYQLSLDDLNKMEKLYGRSIRKNRSGRLEEKYRNQNKFWHKYGLIITIIFELCLMLFTYTLFVRQYIDTSIIKKANIVDAKVLEEDRDRYVGDYFTIDWNVKYEYNVDGNRYETTDRKMIIGPEIFTDLRETGTIKVYYEKDNPNQVEIYQQGSMWLICLVLLIILNCMILIKLIFWRK